jgi:hypothetical protein
VNGWQVQSIYQWQSGAAGFGDIPFCTIQESFNTNAGFDFNSNGNYAFHIRTLPLRSSGLRGMGLNWWDLGASKNTRMSERTSLRFRAEFINALNHTHFSGPQMDPASPPTSGR